MMKILFIGDIVGRIGRETVREYLPLLKKKYKPQLTIANGENAAGGKGITESNYKELLQSGIDIITMGNHTWDNRDIFEFIDGQDKMIRPANYPDNEVTPGKGITYVQVNDKELAVINLHGRALMRDLDSPFKIGEEIVSKAKKRTNHIFIDFHAETTSEKEAMGWYFDGQVSTIVGTHTHVQTNDHRVLPNGTAYVSDVGMTGFYDGILGMNKESILENFLTQMPVRIQPPENGRSRLNGALVTLKDSGKARSIEMIRIDDDHPFLD